MPLFYKWLNYSIVNMLVEYIVLYTSVDNCDGAYS